MESNFVPWMIEMLKKFVQIFLIAIFLIPNLLQAEESQQQNSMAILYFDYEGQNSELMVLKKGLTQMLISHVQSDLPNVQLVERGRLEEVIQELELQKSAAFDQSTSVKIGKLMGAEYLVVGRYFDLFGTLRIDARVLNVQTGEIVATASADGPLSDFFAIEGKLREQLVLGVQGLSALTDSQKESIVVETNPKKISSSTSSSKMESTKQKDGFARQLPTKGEIQDSSQPSSSMEVHSSSENMARQLPIKGEIAPISTATIISYSKALDAKDHGDSTAMEKALSEIDLDTALQMNLDALLQ